MHSSIFAIKPVYLFAHPLNLNGSLLSVYRVHVDESGHWASFPSLAAAGGRVGKSRQCRATQGGNIG